MRLRCLLEKWWAGWRGSPVKSEDRPTATPPDTGQESERKREARLLEGFDWKFYLNFYPDLRQLGITTKRAARKHWLTFGSAEGRISGPRCETYLRNLGQLEQYLESVSADVPSPPEASAPLINILTRTNLRARFFSENRNSIAGQTYKKFRHLVSYENEETYNYLKKYNLPAADLVKVVRGSTGGSHPYNLFVNDMMDCVSEGWIMFLDDDDLFTTPHALSIIASHLKDEDSLVIWRTWFPAKTIPATQDIQQIAPGGITSCCFAFHSKHKAKGQWHEFRAGDYRCFDQLRQHLQPVFLNHILAKINRTDRGEGAGEPSDKRA